MKITLPALALMLVSFSLFPLLQAVSLCWFGLISVSTRHYSLPGRSLSLSVCVTLLLLLTFSFSPSHFLFISIFLSSSPLRVSLPLVVSPSHPSQWLQPLRTLPSLFVLLFLWSRASLCAVCVVVSSSPSWRMDNTPRFTRCSWELTATQSHVQRIWVNQSTDLINLWSFL